MICSYCAEEPHKEDCPEVYWQQQEEVSEDSTSDETSETTERRGTQEESDLPAKQD